MWSRAHTRRTVLVVRRTREQQERKRRTRTRTTRTTRWLCARSSFGRYLLHASRCSHLTPNVAVAAALLLSLVIVHCRAPQHTHEPLCPLRILCVLGAVLGAVLSRMHTRRTVLVVRRTREQQERKRRRRRTEWLCARSSFGSYLVIHQSLFTPRTYGVVRCCLPLSLLLALRSASRRVSCCWCAPTVSSVFSKYLRCLQGARPAWTPRSFFAPCTMRAEECSHHRLNPSHCPWAT